MPRPVNAPVYRFHKDTLPRWYLLTQALRYQVGEDDGPKLAAEIERQASMKKPSPKGILTLRFTRKQRALLGRAIDVVRQDRREGRHR